MMVKDKVGGVRGAARGIGREIALLLAKHGAKVVVNDYGGGSDGAGDARGPADDVVNEIKGQGGQAAASYDSVASMAGRPRHGPNPPRPLAPPRVLGNHPGAPRTPET